MHDQNWAVAPGCWLLHSICNVSDAISGFFAFRRELATTIGESARGYKILLELLVAGQEKLRILEAPHLFS